MLAEKFNFQRVLYTVVQKAFNDTCTVVWESVEQANFSHILTQCEKFNTNLLVI